jgi:hypothetical protein
MNAATSISTMAAGSIDKFMPEYLRQITTVGYLTAPLEIDATQHELV